jgi:tol-pal system protein YbgF
MSTYSPSLRTVLFTAIVSLSALYAVPAQAFADDDARRAILELRQQIKQLTDQNSQARLQLADHLETLQNELTSMRGDLEKMRWELDINKRAGQDQSAASSPKVADSQEQSAFDNSMGLFRSGKYKEAAAGFGQFLGSYPQSQLAPEAKFYRGSSLYASKNFKESVQVLQGMVQTSPTDPRAADALLVIAASQIEQNNTAGAKSSLQKIIKDYPQSSAAETAKSRLKILQ